MKTLKFFALALMCAATLVGCNNNQDDAPEIKSEVPEVAATDGAITVVWNIKDVEVCTELVFAGDYNGYSTDVSTMTYFEPIEGYTGWYKAVITPADPAADPVLTGKPCALAQDGTFPSSWDYQWINVDEKHQCEILKGDGELQVQYETESKLLVKNGTNVIYVRSYGFKTNPCEAIVYEDVTFNLHVILPPTATDSLVYVVGGAFEKSWDASAYPMNRVDEDDWTVTLPARIGQEYKYTLNGAWYSESLAVPEEGKDCSLQLPNNKLDWTETKDTVYGFLHHGATKCEPEVVEGVMYIKHPWAGGADWTWQQMTAGDNNTYTYDAQWGNNGANINVVDADDAAVWYPADQITGSTDLAVGDNVTFTFVSTEGATGTLSVAKK